MLRDKKITTALFTLIISLLLCAGCFSDDSGAGSPAVPSDNSGAGGPVVPGEWDDSSPSATTKIADHSAARLPVLQSIPDSAITNAKSKLIIAYGHTSHGSQIVDGLYGLEKWKGALYGVHGTATTGEIQLRDNPFSGANDLGAPDRKAWEASTRAYLNAHADVNVVMWSWCGQVSSSTEADITNYLNLMNGLETSYPKIKFVYMTGHLDGSGLTGNLHLRNEQIRKYCRDNKKILFDFADIETYGPDGTYYGDKHPNDACGYDGGNWATAWQTPENENITWYKCNSAHSQPVNANMKAYAFWWLMTKIAAE